MAHIDKITEDKIKRAANVVDVIGDFIELRKQGVEYVGLCPFHDDHTLGNFSVNPAKNCYKCFSCGAGGDAVKFLMEYDGAKLSYPDALRWLAKKYSIFIDEDSQQDQRWQHITPAKPRELQEAHREMLVIPRDIVASIAKSSQKNIFVDWFKHLPWSDDQRNNQRARVNETLWLYCVSGYQDGRVCFWQIDEKGRARGGKLMQFYPFGHPKYGHRDKSCNPGWVHNQKGVRERLDLDTHEYRATLFGMHLLNRYPDAAINIVESEKTALVCANAYGHPERSLWMACGGLRFLKLESLQPLIDQGRRVWLWPDRDGVNEWREKVKTLLNDRISITTRFLDENWTEQDGPKADVADIILRHMTKPETYVKRIQPPKPKVENVVVEWDTDEPFLDPEELADERVHLWRETLRRRYNFREPVPTSRVEGVKTVGEILTEYPILNKLINETDD